MKNHKEKGYKKEASQNIDVKTKEFQAAVPFTPGGYSTDKGSDKNDNDIASLIGMTQTLTMRRSSKSVSFGLNEIGNEKTKPLRKSFNSAPADLGDLGTKERPKKRMKR